MTPEVAQSKLGFAVLRGRIEFNERDGNLHVGGQDLLGSARSGARPATLQEEAMWDLLVSEGASR